MQLNTEETLPEDQYGATLVGRAWVPGAPSGPSVIWIREDWVCDLTPRYRTMSELLEEDNPAGRIGKLEGLKSIGSPNDLLANTAPDHRDPLKPWMLAPFDLQAVKESGVTFVSSMLERVIEEQARGDLAKAEKIRIEITKLIGDNLA